MLKETSQELYHKKLTGNLTDDITLLEMLFANDDTLRLRRISNIGKPGLNCALLFLDGMVDNRLINESVVRPLSLCQPPANKKDLANYIKTKVIQASQIETSTDLFAIGQAMLYGDTCLLAEGLTEGFIINSKGWEKRSVSEPMAEQVFRGPREGFTESIMVNTSLLRRKIQNPDLKFQFSNLGEKTRTKICICYIANLCRPELLAEVENRLKTIKLDGILESNYIQEMIKDHPASPFKTIYNTERPDMVAANLLEGRVAIMVDGSPAVLTMPTFFMETFQAGDDYYINYYFSTVSRILRLLSFFITISLPAVYLALMTFHQEILPTPLLLSLASARRDVPIPTILGILILLFIFETLREAGARMPNTIGQALSIVGAIVLGQAAVEARLVSAPAVIVVGTCGITALTIPKMKGMIIAARLILLLLASYAGIYGYLLGMTLIGLHIASLRSFGYYYLGGFADFSPQRQTDQIIRAPWQKMNTRPKYLATEEQRQPERKQS